MSGPRLKYLDANYGQVKRSKKDEERIAEELGGERLARSGAHQWSKHDFKTARGDVITPRLLIEHKETARKSMSLKREWLEKVTEGALDVSRDPAVVITFMDGRKREDWMLVRLEDFKRYMRALEVVDDNSGE